MYQKGRTAIELFSVLLIIGLMTVAGVEMYNYTFSKNTAVMIQKKANSRAASILTSPLLVTTKSGHSLDALGFLRKEENFTWTHTKESSNAFSITISPVKKKVCNLLLSMDTSYLKELRVDGKTNENAVCSNKGSEMTFVYDTGTIKRAPVQPRKCSGNETKCGLGCCPQGTDCCNGMCLEKCTGVGMDGRRDAFTCACLCDETAGLVYSEAVGGCVCQEGKHYEDGKCVCDNTQCDGGILSPDCSCNCATNGKTPKAGNPRVCVECNDNSDCSSASCETCDNNVCVGKCCVKNGLKCDEEDTCCNGLPCPSTGYCCMPSGSSCDENSDCCLGSCSNAGHCCLDIGKTCQSETDCCGNTPCVDNTCCHPLGENCTSKNDCCGVSKGSVDCYMNVCCVTKGGTCDENSPCCSGECINGKCCTPKGERCQATAECCVGICSNGRCCSDYGATCEDDSDCCAGTCTDGVCCAGLGQKCQGAGSCCEGDCVGGICCLSLGKACDETHPCCDGSFCSDKDICCPETGSCGTLCEDCCPKGGKVCSWTQPQKGWVGICTHRATPFYGKDATTHEPRCCTGEEALVPSFNGEPALNETQKQSDMFCCPVEEGLEQYTYYNTSTGKCALLGECPSGYDGVAFIIDLSGSMLWSVKRGTEHLGFPDCPFRNTGIGVLEKQLKEAFESDEVKWENLKVGIYSFSNDAKTELSYEKHSVAELKSAISDLADNCRWGQQTHTGAGLKQAWKNTFGKDSKHTPLFFILTDGPESPPYKGKTVLLADTIDLMQADCDNLFKLYVFGFGDAVNAEYFRLKQSDRVIPYSLSITSIKDVVLNVTKQNLENCIPRDEKTSEICCEVGKRWDDEKKKCTRN